MSWGAVAYRQHSQQRRLACILQPDHRDIHLGRPIHRAVVVSGMA
jgi:hypothetical protein